VQGEGARLVWKEEPDLRPYQADRSSVYWKIGLALRQERVTRPPLSCHLSAALLSLVYSLNYLIVHRLKFLGLQV
jgi:hypothetical protein